MRHHNKNKKFGRKRDERKALIRSLAVNLIRKEQITTTEAKAKSLRPFVEKLLTKAKSDKLANKRLIVSRLGENKRAEAKLSKLAKSFKNREGGYTRITKLGARQGDASPMAVIEFVK